MQTTQNIKTVYLLLRK